MGKIIGWIILGIVGCGIFLLPFLRAFSGEEPWWTGFAIWAGVIIILGLVLFGIYLVIE